MQDQGPSLREYLEGIIKGLKSELTEVKNELKELRSALIEKDQHILTKIDALAARVLVIETKLIIKAKQAGFVWGLVGSGAMLLFALLVNYLISLGDK